MRAIKFENNDYLDSTGIVHNKVKLFNILSNLIKTTKSSNETSTYSCSYINSTIIPVVKFSGDFNNYTENAVGSCDGLTINKPTSTAFYGAMIVLKYANNYCCQLAIDVNSGYIYSRVLLNSKWQTWKKITTTNVS